MDSCGTCFWGEEWIPEDQDDPAILFCRYPTSLLPLCMQGVAQRERETVNATDIGCPVWKQK